MYGIIVDVVTLENGTVFWFALCLFCLIKPLRDIIELQYREAMKYCLV